MLTAITPDATPDGSIPLSGPVVPGCQTCTLMPFSA
jgi:hypothetical protein